MPHLICSYLGHAFFFNSDRPPVLEFNLPTLEDPYPTPPKSFVFAAEGRSRYIQKVIFCRLNDNEEYVSSPAKRHNCLSYPISTS